MYFNTYETVLKHFGLKKNVLNIFNVQNYEQKYANERKIKYGKFQNQFTFM